MKLPCYSPNRVRLVLNEERRESLAPLCKRCNASLSKFAKLLDVTCVLKGDRGREPKIFINCFR